MKTLKTIVLLLPLIFMSCGNSKIERDNPTQVIYQDLVESTPEYDVYKTCYYTLDSIRLDTIAHHQSCSVLPRENHMKNLPAGAVDLNAIFTPCPDIDWNYSDLTIEQVEFLDSLNIHYDPRLGRYMKEQ